MSRAVLNAILNEMQILLNEIEREQLYHELTAYFGLIGAINECTALEAAWKDPYNRHEIEEFIRAWLKRKQKKLERIEESYKENYYITWVKMQRAIIKRNIQRNEDLTELKR